MPLRKGRSKKVVASNIGEMLRSSTFGKGKSANKRRSMAIAAAHRKAGQKRKKR